MNDLNIACLPADLPEFIEVDLSTLALNHSIHVSDLKLPKGVESAGIHIGNAVVATVQVPRGAVEAEALAAATAGAAAPADAKAAAKPAAKSK
jgi:large subunit ribosomal protein L25